VLSFDLIDFSDKPDKSGLSNILLDTIVGPIDPNRSINH